ncbi:MAG: dockerin type I repeat-containing protein [Clostridia bacterium]|nr:dockerin type I repeat-containing protein [Clostridia bacterium]
MKKVIAILLTLVLSLSIIVPASAEENESYVTLDKDIIYLKVGEQAELNVSDVNLVEDPSAPPAGNPNYETWTVADDEIVSLQLTGGEEGNVAYPDNLVNQTAVLTGLKEGTTVVKVERGGFGTYAYDECTVVVSDADGEVYMIYDCEDTDDSVIYIDTYYSVVGPVQEGRTLSNSPTPAPTQGNCSYAINGYSNILIMYQDLASVAGIFDATSFEYVEFDIYSSEELICNLSLRLYSSNDQSSYGVPNVYIPANEWVHVKMSLAEFGEFSEDGGSFDNIDEIAVYLTGIVDPYKVATFGVNEAPERYCVYFDNFIATSGDMAGVNELEEFDINTWEPKDSESNQPEHATVLGDTNRDKIVDASDALNILQYAVGKLALTEALARCDVDGSGEVNAVDALLILQYSVQKIRKFPVEVANLPDTLMLYDCETSEGATDNSMNTLESVKGPVLQNIHLGHPTPTQGDYSYCINTSGNQVMLNYTFPDSVDLSAYNYIEFDIYSYFEIVCNLNIDIATDTAATTGANWVLSDSWIPGERWYHVKIPISAFSDSTGIYGGSFEKVKQIKIELSKIVDGVELVDNGYPTTPDYTYIYFDNITATKNGAGKDNELIDIDTLMVTPPEWFEEYRSQFEQF